jgi:hypothetical protein
MKFVPPVRGRAWQVEASHQVILLLKRRPDLWPRLNDLTLVVRQAPPVDWIKVLKDLRHAEAAGLAPSNACT